MKKSPRSRDRASGSNVDKLSITHEEARAQQQAVENDHTMENLRRTPKGLWYPTQVVRRTAKEPNDSNSPRILLPTSFTSFLLDFNAEIPDSLFTKKERTAGFTGGLSMRAVRIDNQLELAQDDP